MRELWSPLPDGFHLGLSGREHGHLHGGGEAGKEAVGRWEADSLRCWAEWAAAASVEERRSSRWMAIGRGDDGFYDDVFGGKEWPATRTSDDLSLRCLSWLSLDFTSNLRPIKIPPRRSSSPSKLRRRSSWLRGLTALARAAAEESSPSSLVSTGYESVVDRKLMRRAHLKALEDLESAAVIEAAAAEEEEQTEAGGGRYGGGGAEGSAAVDEAIAWARECYMSESGRKVAAAEQRLIVG